MKGHCRFLRTKDGRSYFARVGLVIQPGGGSVEVVEALPARPNTDEGEVNRLTAPGWVAAALEGIHAALQHAQQIGLLPTGGRVCLDELAGSPVDTRDDVVRCAAGLAVWKALGEPKLAPNAEFADQKWDLVFPVTAAALLPELRLNGGIYNTGKETPRP